jgi:D-beta-D-heptose 7-phosphate kinase/D-beta-D-heptose 1-phosphate adenosyltransferase
MERKEKMKTPWGKMRKIIRAKKFWLKFILVKGRCKSKVVAVSGGFDPVHIGHIRLFEEAKKLGDKLVVILNNDNWLRRKKGGIFMSQEERAEILKSLKFVDDVILTRHSENSDDMSVCAELETLKPHVFANGGDRRCEKDIPEAEICRKFGIKMVFNVGGEKIRSSSDLLRNYSISNKEKR